MSKVVQAFLIGSVITFILDFQFFLGIKLHYLDYYEIDEYYNILFADHQNLLYLIPLVILTGLVTMYINSTKFILSVLGVVTAITLLVFIPSIGERVGAYVLQKDNVRYEDARYIYKGTLYYEGRYKITLFDDELQRLITLDKKDLKE
ncbi:MAG: hypothetical protein U9R50_12385 [Campylobacterota bacterium]|nr:hypothetical protein [Campylobacterota bacterium]